MNHKSREFLFKLQNTLKRHLNSLRKTVVLARFPGPINTSSANSHTMTCREVWGRGVVKKKMHFFCNGVHCVYLQLLFFIHWLLWTLYDLYNISYTKNGSVNAVSTSLCLCFSMKFKIFSPTLPFYIINHNDPKFDIKT